MPDDQPKPSSALLWLKRIVPLVLAAAVMVYIFAYQIDFADRKFKATVESVDTALHEVKVKLEEGGKDTTLPWSSAPDFAKPAPQGYAGRESEAVGQTLVFNRPGVLTHLKALNWLTLLAVVAFLILGYVIQSARLAILYNCLGYRLKLFDAIRATLVGLFYGNVIPAGQVGGDPVKALYMASWTGSSKTHALAAVFIDRAIGLVMLAVLAVAAAATQIADERYRYALLVIGAFFVVSVAGMALALSPRMRAALGLSAIAKKLPGAAKLAGFAETLSIYRGHGRAMFWASVSALVSHLCFIGTVVAVGWGLGLSETAAGSARLDMGDYLTLVPVANMVTCLPGSPPGGWGLGEGAYILFFGSKGVIAEQAVIMSAVPRLMTLALSLFGFFAILSRSRAAAK